VKTTAGPVSRIFGEFKTQFESWSARRLDDVELDYLFLDGSHFKYHANASAEPVLAGWGIDTGVCRAGGHVVGVRRSLGGLFDWARRARAGLPLLVISDGAAGLIGAVERTMGAALRQRCRMSCTRRPSNSGAHHSHHGT
jgi:putative transposase